MQPSAIPCLTCDRPTARLLYNQNMQICATCQQTLDNNETAIRASDKVRAELANKAAHKAGNKAARRSRLLDQIAREGKVCSSCRALKPGAEFAVCRSRPDGLQTECRGCMQVRTLMLKAGSVSSWHVVRDAMRTQSAGRSPAKKI